MLIEQLPDKRHASFEDLKIARKDHWETIMITTMTVNLKKTSKQLSNDDISILVIRFG